MARSFQLADYVYAHRGLWGDHIPENSLAAFRRASLSGLGAECDVHMAADGEAVVHHDFTLERMTGQPLAIRDMHTGWLSLTPLSGTEETIPTLSEVLSVMNEQPLLIELKVDETTDRRGLVLAVLESLADHHGPAALMSFDAEIITIVRELDDTIQTGLLTPPLRLKSEDGCAQTIAELNVAKADFLAPHVVDIMDARSRLGPDKPLACWTISEPEHIEFAEIAGAAPIFEKVTPDLVSAPGAPK